MTLYKYCRRCGKRLKGEENRIRGYGKTCFEHVRRGEDKGLSVLVLPDALPIEIIYEPKDEKGKNQQSKAQSKAKARVKSKEISEQEQSQEQGNAQESEQSIKAKQESKGQSKKNFQEQEQSKGARPPHLEKTLTPTRKKPMLFMPHTATPTPL